MRQTNDNSAYSTLKLHSSASPGARHPAETQDLSDREAVIAVMAANGLTCQDIATRLSLPLLTVEDHLQQALSILNLANVEDVTYVIVAAHYNRNSRASVAPSGGSAATAGQAPEAFHQAEGTPGSDSLTRLRAAHNSRPRQHWTPIITSTDLNSLVILDATEAAREDT